MDPRRLLILINALNDLTFDLPKFNMDDVSFTFNFTDNN